MLLAVSAGCGEGDGPGTTGSGEVSGTILVFAAASLTDAFAEVEAAFERANPGVDVQVSFAGSSTLREQILEGAPADVVASANEATMTQLVDAGEVSGTPEVFVTNSLKIAVPVDNPAGVTGLDDFADPDKLIGLCVEEVPCGEFARQALRTAGITPSIDTEEPDVRALLAKVGEGDLDAGIVYVTDVKAAGDHVTGIDLPKDANVEARYPIANLSGSPNPGGAAAFTAFVLSDEGRGILTGFGFATP